MTFNTAEARKHIAELVKSNMALTAEIEQLYAELAPLKESRRENKRHIHWLKQQIADARNNVPIP